MHILIIPKSFNDHYVPISGIFYKQQVESISLCGGLDLKIGVVSVTFVSFKSILSKRGLKLGLTITKENDINIYNFHILSIPKLKVLNYFLRMFVFKLMFKKYLKEEGMPDLSHVHVFEAGEPAIWLKSKYQIPYIVTEHSSLFATSQISKLDLKIANNVYKNSSYNIAVSKCFEKLLSSTFGYNFDYIPNLVDTDFFSLSENKSSIGSINFIAIGNLTSNKNHSLMIKAFVKAFGVNPNYRLIIVGGGPTQNSLLKLIKSLNAEDVITLYGETDRDHIKTLLHSSHYFLHSSIYETFGIVLIEAMSCGLPVLSTKCQGPETIITNGYLGIVCENDNENAYAESLIKLINTKFDRELIRQYVLDNFSGVVVANRIINVYKKVIITT